jgi:hypothetical protein
MVKYVFADTAYFLALSSRREGLGQAGHCIDVVRRGIRQCGGLVGV